MGNGINTMGVGSEGPWPWIFILGTGKVEGGFTVLFLGLVFSVAPPPPLENFLPMPLINTPGLHVQKRSGLFGGPVFFQPIKSF